MLGNFVYHQTTLPVASLKKQVEIWEYCEVAYIQEEAYVEIQACNL